MKHESFEAKLIRQQNLYIRQLEEQLNVCMEKTGKKPGAQPGHPHHLRKTMKPDKVVEIPVEEKFKDNARYVSTGTVISRQVIGIAIVPVVTEYCTMEFHDKKKGRNVHSTFPAGASNDVNYDESMKAVLFLLNSRCNVSLEKSVDIFNWLWYDKVKE